MKVLSEEIKKVSDHFPNPSINIIVNTIFFIIEDCPYENDNSQTSTFASAAIVRY